MTDERDPILLALFQEAHGDLDGETFTARVLDQTRSQRYLVILGLSCLGMVLAGSAWFFNIPVEVAQLITQALTTTLIDLGNSWVAWLFSPINNVASLLVLGVKAIRVFQQRIVGASYVN
jgi:hypothetical protein